MKKYILSLLVATTMASPTFAQTEKPPQPTFYQRAEAQYAAYKILRLIDTGNYGELLKVTAPDAKGELTEKAFTETLASLRKTFGTYGGNRELERHGFSESAANGKKGLFYMSIFRTQFSSLKGEEKLVLSFEAGEWKLGGYFLSTAPAK